VAEPFLSEIRLFTFNFAPRGWATCDGQVLPINQNQALFSLLGTTYGGNGQTTFALPDLRGRTPIHVAGAHPLGQPGGEQAHTLTQAETPAHTHVLSGTANNGSALIPAGNLLAATPNQLYHGADNSQTTMASESVARVGGSQPHDNMQPYLTVSFCIALLGIFPSRN